MITRIDYWKTLLGKLRVRAFAPVDIASIVFLRIAFGGLLVWHVCRYFARGNIAAFWIEPRFLFKFYGFSWVQPWPSYWLYIHWGLLGLFAFFVAIGFCYRVSALLLFLSYTYFFLLDQARYVNHSYLACLFSFLFIFIPAHRAFSVEARLRTNLRSQTVPAWCLWILRFQIGVVYFFAGLAKISPDWLRGEPMRFRLSHAPDFPILGSYAHEGWAVYGASYGSMLFDLLIVPLLLWRRTRVAAFCLALAFHLTNASVFPLEFFPWLAIAATSLYFSPDWPRRLFAFLNEKKKTSRARVTWNIPVWQQRAILSALAFYVAIQIFLPLRYLLTPGGIEWNHAEHLFSWRMLLVNQASRGYFYVTDPNSGQTTQVPFQGVLTPRQRAMLGYLPDYPLQYAHYLAQTMPRTGPLPLRVEARIFVAINGRKAQLYLDPNVDLAQERRPFLRPRWLNVINDPLPPPEERYRGEQTSFR